MPSVTNPPTLSADSAHSRNNRAATDAQVPKHLAAENISEVQIGFDSLGTPLTEIMWLIVDVETTGLGIKDTITEIGAVKMRAGLIVDEFSTMVNPQQPIPNRITNLTGITDEMVADAPGIAEALPLFLQWAEAGDTAMTDAIFVAHNANFDLRFLKQAARIHDLLWPRMRIVDTLALARLILPRPIVANHKLATLSTYFASQFEAGHRALDDARATSQVLQGLLNSMLAAGVSSIEDIVLLGTPPPPFRRAKAQSNDQEG